MILHRDIKPENVLIDSSPDHSSLFLADFGISLHIQEGSLEEAHAFVSGTPGYIDPYFLRLMFGLDSKKVMDVSALLKTDIFGVACIFHYLITGEPLVSE